MPVQDIRLRIDFRDHPKTRRLRRVLGDSGVRCLIWLWLGVASRRPDGELYGWDAEELELEADWPGPPHGLVDVLLQQGWLEKRDDGLLVLHDWPENQEWVVGASGRKQRSTDAARARWEKEREKARIASRIPSASTDVDESSDASRMPGALPDAAVDVSGNAPLPSFPLLSVPSQLQERVGPGGAVVVHTRQPNDLALVAATFAASGLGGPIDFANSGLFRTWTEEWLERGYPAAHVALCLQAVAVAAPPPSKPLYAVRSLVETTKVGTTPVWSERTAGDGTTGRGRGRSKGHDARSLNAEAARLEAEGK